MVLALSTIFLRAHVCVVWQQSCSEGPAALNSGVASRKKRPITVQTIAQHVGVSTAAVSTVLANRQTERRLAPATVERIQRAVRELGYVPNISARRLRTRDPNIGHFDLAILTTYEAPLFLVSRILRQMQRMVDARSDPSRNYSVSIDVFHAGRLSAMAGLQDASRFHGVIITNTLPADDAFLNAITLPYPVVMIGRQLPNYCCVLETPGQTGRMAADILLEAGIRHPLVLTPALLTQTTADRADSFCERVRSQTKMESARIAAQGFTASAAADALRDYWSEGRRCDGIFAVTDSLAIGAYQAVKDGGRKIPRDVSLVGIGDHEHAEFFDPPLTCVGPVYDTVVDHAAKLLFHLMNHRRVTPAEVLVPPAAVLRGSV